jgi:CelD/BcsL family acetyltransferase involved in cellulose biosynthesis
MNAVTKISIERAGESAPDAQQACLSNKAEYAKLCETEPSIPIFSTDWWLDAAAGAGNWDVALVKANGRIVGAMPYASATRFGMKVIQNPALTPMLGPWILPNGEKNASRIGNEQKIMQSLIEQLPRFDHFRQAWHKGLSNWLPFYWNGFSQSTEYTYVLSPLDKPDAIWNGLDSARRKHCKHGVERFKLRVRDDLSVDAFLALQKMTLARRGVAPSYPDDLLRRVDAACEQRNCRKILIVVDEAGRHCAATYTVWDRNCAYALIKGSDPEMFHTGAPSLCQWESIKFCSTVASSYDFLGNMNASIEPYVRSFGTVQTPVFSISKTPSRLLRLRHGLKSALE